MTANVTITMTLHAFSYTLPLQFQLTTELKIDSLLTIPITLHQLISYSPLQFQLPADNSFESKHDKVTLKLASHFNWQLNYSFCYITSSYPTM